MLFPVSVYKSSLCSFDGQRVQLVRVPLIAMWNESQVGEDVG